MSGTAAWLQSGRRGANFMCSLTVSGLNRIFVSRSSAEISDAAVRALYAGTDWETDATIHRGLDLFGDVKENARPFTSGIGASEMTFKLLDDGSLGSIFFASNLSTATRTTLTADLFPGVNALSVKSVTGWSNDDYAYLGTETILVDDASDFDPVTRAQYSVYETEAPARWQPDHALDSETSNAPIVSSSPRNNCIGRTVIAKLHHFEHGAFVSYDDAFTVFQGRIESVGDGGQGWIQLKCLDLRDRLRTMLLREQYHGNAKNGMYLTAQQAAMTFVAVQSDGAGTIVNFIPPTATLAGVGTLQSHSELAGSIEKQFQTWKQAATGLVPDAAADNLSMTLSGSGEEWLYRLKADFRGTALAGDLWSIHIGLSIGVWLMLGFDTSGDSVHLGGDLWVVLKSFGETDTDGVFKLAATGPPSKLVLFGDASGVIEVEDAKGTYDEQPAAGLTRLGVPAATDGFLKVGDISIIAVDKTATDTFTMLEFVGKRFAPLGGQDIKAKVDDRDVIRIADDYTNSPIPVSQVWIEIGDTQELFLQLLLSSGSAWNSATYDTHPRQMGLNFPYSLVDLDAFLALGNEPFLLSVMKPTPFRDYLQSVLVARGYAQPQWNSDGVLTLRKWGSDAAAGEANIDLNEDNFIFREGQAPPMEIDSSLLINRITLKYNRTLEGSYASDITINAPTSQGELEITKGHSIELDGVHDNFGYLPGGSLSTIAARIASSILPYFSRPTAVVRRTFDLSLVTKMMVGERCALTDSYVFDPETGTRGVTSLPCWVLGWSFDWRSGEGEVELAYCPEIRSRLWASSGRVDETATNGGLESGGLARFTLKEHVYSDSSQAADASRMKVTYKVHIQQIGTTAPLEWDRIVSAQAGNTVTVATAIGTPTWVSTNNYVMEYQPHTADVTEQKSDYSFIADDADDLIAAAVSPHTWGQPTESTVFVPSLDLTEVYRKTTTDIDDKGEPMSVHKVHHLAAWANLASLHHTAAHLLNEQYNSTDEVTQTGTTPKLAFVGMMPLPGYNYRQLKFIVRGAVDGGTGTFRVRFSNSPPSGTSDTSLAYVDGGVYETTITTTSATRDYLTEETISGSEFACVNDEGFGFCYVAVEIFATTGDEVTFCGIEVREDGS